MLPVTPRPCNGLRRMRFNRRTVSMESSLDFTLQTSTSSVVWEVLEPSSADSQAAAKSSQLPARQPVVPPPRKSAASAVLSPAQQKTRCRATPGLRWESPQGVTGVTSVTDARADYSPIDRRCRPGTDVRICLGSLNASLFWSSHWGDESVARSFTD